MGAYKLAVQVDHMLYVSGHGPLLSDGTMIRGRLGESMDTQAGYDAARQTGLAILATIRAHCGSLDRVARFVKTLGLVNAVPDFAEQPAVINGFSELMRDVFGEDAGVSARSAVGAGSLPGGIAVEIETIVELKP
jgi:enamine deaminase RidA (YjgF/YER057c/UK114 family)